MNNMDEMFPKFQKKIENLIEDEEGKIPGKKLLMLGTLMVVLGNLLSIDAFAGHSSHSSHSSGSHGSHGNHGSHESHVSHQSHSNTHSSHASHTSHSNVAAHSNSLYSSEGDVSYSAPAASTVPQIKTPVVKTTADTFKLPNVNENIEIPNGTPTSSIVPTLAIPASTVGTQIDANEINKPTNTDSLE